MSELEKATLQEISNDDKSTPVGDPVEVQFNPTTLRLQLRNSIEGGQSKGRQTRDYVGASSTVLTLDLTFDTADEGWTGWPVSVRDRTETVEYFMRPSSEGDENQVVPRVRFCWGDLVLDGVVESLSLEFDHFASDGTPLRAKASLSLKEQDPRLELLESGRGANRRDGWDAPGGGLGFGAGVGLGLGFSAGIGVSAGFGANLALGATAGLAVGVGGQASVALGGESLAELSARAGLDPARWRALAAGIEDPLWLEAGAEVSFSPSLDLSLGIAASSGASSGIDVSVEAKLGLETSGATRSALAEAGFALTAAGGVTSAIESVSIQTAEAAADAARSAFAAPAPPSTRRISPGTAEASARLPLASMASTPGRRVFEPAPAPPRADRRASSFGAGVPLRPLRHVEEAAASVVQGATTPPSRRDVTSLWTADPTSPPWERLPRSDTARQRADESQRASDRRRACGCVSHPKGGPRCRCTSAS